MTAQEHPEYEDEKGHLDGTLLYVYRELARLKEPIVVQAADNRAAQIVRNVVIGQKADLTEARKQAYFGRVDWQTRGDQGFEVFYIGKYSLPKVSVFSWADTLVADLYYTQATRRENGQLLLKRTFDINERALQEIRDEFVHPSQQHRTGRAIDRFTDSLFRELLASPRTGQLHDIVATLQEQQYAIIRSPKDQLLVVQGVTGSGKTEIALHRVAYLLYNHRSTGDVNPKNVLVLGPSRIFINYVANVLPQLGERQIPQNTFDAWLIERLGIPVEYEPQDSSLELLLNPALPESVRAMRYRNARNKGSISMAILIDRYIDILHDELLIDAQPLVCSVTVGGMGTDGTRQRLTSSTTKDVDSLREMLEKVRNLPLNARRDALKERLIAELSQELNRQLRASFPGEDHRQEVAKQIQPQVDRYFADWRNLNVSVAYRRLLRTPHLLQRAGEGVFSSWDLELLAQDAPTALRPYRFSDLGGLLYLKLRLDGTDGIRYDHIVIDEAQDITPLHFKVLYEYSRNGSMTIMGDLAQGIYPHHGVTNWTELTTLGGLGSLHQEVLRQSYRSTREIIEYANSLRRRIGVEEESLAQPIARSGPPPALHQCIDQSDLVDNIVAIVQNEIAQGRGSIALVCKTARSSKALAESLAGRIAAQLVDNQVEQYQGKTAIIPSYLTKGLEFDCVVVVDAEADTYGPNELDARLLYVALTRASHSLHVCWSGALTPLLDEEVARIHLLPLFEGSLEPKPVTIEHYAMSKDGVNADRYVEKLAAIDRLHLLTNGRIDQIVLEALVGSSVKSTITEEEETTVPALDSSVEAALRSLVETWDQEARMEAVPALEVDEQKLSRALAFLQLTYGLLRLQMRSAGLDPNDESGIPVADQVVPMVALLKAVQGGFVLNSGRWTTRQRALQAVDERRRRLAEEQLLLLTSYGIVEESAQARRPQVRVLPDHLAGLLRLSLGHLPDAWDTDLIAQLPNLPLAVTWRGTEEEA